MKRDLDILGVVSDGFHGINQRMDRLDSRVGALEVMVARNTVSLDEHMRRTEALEKSLEQHKDSGHAIKLRTIAATVGIITSIATAFVALLKAIRS
jgi:hypothetical protein